MAESFSSKIKHYWTQAGVDVPTGFHRHSASRYALIDLAVSPNKLIDKTWLTQDDLLNYISHYGDGRPFRILDFKDRIELRLAGDQKLSRGDAF